MRTFPELSNDAVFLFRFRPCPVTEELRPLYQGWLDSQETERLGRFQFDVHRREFLYGRALVRYVLSHYLDIGPAEVRFSKSEFGKPYIDSNESIHFNLSHSRGTSVLALSAAGPVGVDLEQVDASHDGIGIAERYFSQVEHQYLLRLPAAERPASFFSLWALKESFIKATGKGLSLPLATFTYEIRLPELRLLLPADLYDAGPWFSELTQLDDGFICARTLTSRNAVPASRFFDLVPGASFAALPVETLARGRSFAYQAPSRPQE
jgi:phosphopantetheinyl transferase